jgi:hypothetical protein
MTIHIDNIAKAIAESWEEALWNYDREHLGKTLERLRGYSALLWELYGDDYEGELVHDIHFLRCILLRHIEISQEVRRAA